MAKTLSSFINEVELQTINEVLSSGKTYDWEESTETIPAKRVDFSGTFTIDDEQYHVAFFNSTPYFGKFGKYMTITRQTGDTLSKTLNFTSKDLLMVLRTVMSITEAYLKANRKISGIAFLFPMKYVNKAKVINKIIKYVFRNKPRLKLSLRGAVEGDTRISGRNFILFYTRKGAEFEGKHFGRTNANDNDFYYSLATKDLLEPEDEQDVASVVSDYDEEEVKTKTDKVTKTPEVSSKEPMVKAKSKEVGQPSPEEKEVIVAAELDSKEQPKEEAMFEVPQDILKLEGQWLRFKKKTPSRKYKYGAPVGTYTIFRNIEPYSKEEGSFVTDEITIDTSMTGDAGKLKYNVKQNLGVKFVLEQYEIVSRDYDFPVEKFKDSAVDKVRKEALVYYENAVDLSDHQAGSSAINITDSDLSYVQDVLPPLNDHQKKLYLSYCLNSEFDVRKIEGKTILSDLEDTLSNEYFMTAKDLMIRAFVDPTIPKFDFEQIEFELAHSYGYAKDYSYYRKLWNGERYVGDVLDSFKKYGNIEFESKEQASSYFKSIHKQLRQLSEIDDKFFIYNVVMMMDFKDKTKLKVPEPRYMMGQTIDYSDMSADELKAYCLGTANRIRQNGNVHTLHDLTYYANEEKRAGISFSPSKIRKLNGIPDIKQRIESQLSTGEKEDLARKIGPDTTILFNLSKYSPDEEIFKIDFIDSWVFAGGSDSQAAAFSWMKNFGPYNKGNLYNFSTNIYENDTVSENALKHFDNIYQQTQDFLKVKYGKKYKDGKGTVKLYRGVGLDYNQVVNYIPGSIESWSLAKSTAKTFAKMMGKESDGTVLEATVPFDAVFMTYESVRGYFPPEENLKGKKEYIIFGGVLSEYAAYISDTNRTLSFSEWIEMFNEENEMGIKLRIVTTDDEDYEELLSSGNLVTGIEEDDSYRKIEYDEDGNLKTYPDLDEDNEEDNEVI